MSDRTEVRLSVDFIEDVDHSLIGVCEEDFQSPGMEGGRLLNLHNGRECGLDILWTKIDGQLLGEGVNAHEFSGGPRSTTKVVECQQTAHHFDNLRLGNVFAKTIMPAGAEQQVIVRWKVAVRTKF